LIRPTIGRKPLPAPQFQEVAEVQIAEAVGNLTPAPADMWDVFEFGGRIRAAQALEMVEKFSQTAKLRIFEEVRKSKTYRQIPIKFPDGSLAVAKDFQEFCRVALGENYLCPVAMQEYLRKTAQEAAKLRREQIERYVETGISCDDTHKNRDDSHAVDAGGQRPGGDL
jgi:hypothetical protein